MNAHCKLKTQQRNRQNELRSVIIMQFFWTFALIVVLSGLKCNTLSVRRVNLRRINLELSPLDESNWHNYGFENVNTTQMSSNSGAAEQTPSLLLMARKSAKLVTSLKDFDGNFVSIKFSSLIGKSVEVLAPAVQPVTISPTTPTPTAAINTLATTIVPEKTPSTVLESNPVSPLVGSILFSAESINSTSHSSIIQISLDPSNPHLKTEIHKIMRKKRELDSSDILQIHQIINLANANKDKLIVPLPVQNTIKSSIQLEDQRSQVLATTKISDLQQDEVAKSIKTENIGLAYKNWRTTTISKSSRPPGFYLLIDDKVVFDNWGGVWNDLPNVIGKSTWNSRLQISNLTDMLYTWENIATNRFVKISFEWEPPDSSTFLFLDDISVDTYEGNGNDVKNQAKSIINITANDPQHKVSDEPTGNRNITIYIVVKSDSIVKTTTDASLSSLNSNAEKGPVQLDLLSGNAKSQNITITPLTGGSVKNESFAKPKKELNYVLIVLAVFIFSFFIILVFLLWIKMSGGTKCGRMSCLN